MSKIESGPNYITVAHAFVKATLRLGLRASLVARDYSFILICLLIICVSYTSIVIIARCGAQPQHHDTASKERKLTMTYIVVCDLHPFCCACHWLYHFMSVTSLNLKYRSPFQ